MIHLSGNSYCPSAFEVLGKKMSEPITTGVVAVLQIVYTS